MDGKKAGKLDQKAGNKGVYVGETSMSMYKREKSITKMGRRRLKIATIGSIGQQSTQNLMEILSSVSRLSPPSVSL